MFSSTEMAVAWAGGALGARACTHVPRSASGAPAPEDAGAPFCLVERTGGELAYPHDSPQFAFQCWSRSEAEAEAMANMLAIATRTMPPSDHHVNTVGTPSILSYGLMDGGWFVWQCDVSFETSLLD